MFWSHSLRGPVPRITPDSGLIMGLPAVKAHYADIIRRISPTRYHQIPLVQSTVAQGSFESCEQWLDGCVERVGARNSSRPKLA